MDSDSEYEEFDEVCEKSIKEGHVIIDDAYLVTFEHTNCVDLDKYLETEVQRYEKALSETKNNKKIEKKLKKLKKIKAQDTQERYLQAYLLVKKNIWQAKQDLKEKQCEHGGVYIKDSHYVTGYESDCVDIEKFRKDYKEDTLNMYEELYKKGQDIEFPDNVVMAANSITDKRAWVNMIEDLVKKTRRPLFRTISVKKYVDVQPQTPWFKEKRSK